MNSKPPALIPELDVSDLSRSLRFYVDIIGFDIAFERASEQFVYLKRAGVHLMLQSAEGPGRRFRTAELQKPYGRGVNFQIQVTNVYELHTNAQAENCHIVVPLEERWYQQSTQEVGSHQFVVADPDGYLLRLFSDLGVRNVGP